MTEPDPAARPGSRAARMRLPLARGVLADIAAEYGVCLHPVVLRRTDTATGETSILEVPCGATLSSKCAPCAEKARRLRMQQLREGWHLDQEPAITPRPAEGGERALVILRGHLEFERAEAEAKGDGQGVADLDTAIAEVDQTIAESDLRGTLTPAREPVARRQRSTRRRADVPDLPRHKIEPRTVGRTFEGNDGRTFRPSLLITPTLGSYGPVHSARRPRRPECDCGTAHPDADPLVGTPLDPATYDYRRAALDAIHFARLLDRFWQNLRRAVGWHVQYGGCVELQRRLAPHAHFAVRGTIPRKLIKTVAAATYHQVWWPAHEVIRYTPDRPPTWDEDAGAFIDTATGEILPTWDDALDTLDDQGEAAEPAHVARLGTVDVRGIVGGGEDAERAIRYVTKYLAKDLTEAVSPTSDPQRAHYDRLHDQLRQLPCAATCANWLLYGVQPRGAHGKLKPGQCRGKVHQRATLGFTGRRVPVSRQWSNKTLTDHRADNRAWVHDLLGLSATEPADQDKPAPRYRYQIAKRGDPDVPPVEHRILHAISTRVQWRKAIEHAQQLSATTPAA